MTCLAKNAQAAYGQYVMGDVQPSLKGGRHVPSLPIGVYGPRLSECQVLVMSTTGNYVLLCISK